MGFAGSLSGAGAAAPAETSIPHTYTRSAPLAFKRRNIYVMVTDGAWTEATHYKRVASGAATEGARGTGTFARSTEHLNPPSRAQGV